MRGINPKNIPMLIARDVATCRKEAKVLVDVSYTGVKNAVANPNGRLGVIAVIGPGEFQGKMYDEAVLCEIGIGVGRPYHIAKKPRETLKEGEFREISQRRKWFSLTSEQYLAVSSILFMIFQKLTNDRVKEWKHGYFSADPFLIKTTKSHFSRSRKKVFQRVSYSPVKSGVRFAVSKQDELLIADIFWAEMECFETRHMLGGLARFMDLCLAWSPHRKKSAWRYTRANISKKPGKVKRSALEAVSVLREKSPHLIPEILKYIPRKKENPRWPYYEGILASGLNSGETPEKILANLAAQSDPKARLNGMLLRVTTHLRTRRDHIVFEVSPNYD